MGAEGGRSLYLSMRRERATVVHTAPWNTTCQNVKSLHPCICYSVQRSSCEHIVLCKKQPS